MLGKVREAVEKNIRPQLQAHGGDIEVLGVKDGIVTVRMTGACSGCPASQVTFEYIIKAELSREVPEIKDVRLETVISKETLDFAKSILNSKKD